MTAAQQVTKRDCLFGLAMLCQQSHSSLTDAADAVNNIGKLNVNVHIMLISTEHFEFNRL